MQGSEVSVETECGYCVREGIPAFELVNEWCGNRDCLLGGCQCPTAC